MAETRQSKLRRLDNYRRSVPHASVSALAKIAETIRDMPDMHYRSAFKEARDRMVSQITPYGPVLQQLDLESIAGGELPLLIAHPFAQLFVSYSNCEPFRLLINDACAKRPPSHDSPWNIIRCSDEIVPSNNLSYENRRKNLWYISASSSWGPNICATRKLGFA